MFKAVLINPFLESALCFLKQEISAEATRGQLRLESSRATSGEINVAIGVTGDAEGIVIYSMFERTAKAVASAMIGEPVPVFDQLAESAIAEMGNIITGQATIGLEECGYACKLSPPTLVSGVGVVISTLDIQRLIIPLEMPQGHLEMSVALRQVKRK
ncbi:MAG TPA: chemotaxis protein CheX [Firmicutes bacterium]|jgi:chemotaxis protein CheX|nr:chemotaxis protein CheX [Bacillota bacterium]